MKNTGSGKTVRLVHTLLAFLIALFSGAGLLPPVRTRIVDYVAANYMHRELNMAYWTQQLFALAFLVFLLNLIVYLSVRSKRGRALALALSSDVKEKVLSLGADWKPLLIIFAIFSVGMISVIRADVFYGGADDLYRAMSGSRAWRNFYRYVSHFLSIFIHTSPKVFDIAPLTQILALIVMSVTALIIIRISTPHNDTPVFSPALYMAVVPVCLFPYFMENISYRYDAPYMALSVLFCVFPFLFMRRLLYFALVSLPCLFLMCLSYQAASGVYIVACAFCVFDMWTRNKIPLSRILYFTLTAIVCYALTLLIFFAIFNVQPVGNSYVDKNLNIAAFSSNAKAYLTQIWQDFGHSSIKLSLILLLPLFVFVSCLTSKRSRLSAALVSILLFFFAGLFSYGAFLVMGKPLLEPRSMFPFGIVVAFVCVRIASWLSAEKASGRRLRLVRGAARLLLFILSYSCLVFAFAYGNAHASQKKYTNFRLTLLLQDLSRVVKSGQDDIHVFVLSDIDYTLAVKNLERTYPVATRMIENMGGHAVIFYLEDYGFGVQAETDKYSDWSRDLENYDIVSDNLYHTIYARDNEYYILFKEPGLTLRE
ncbi:MAG: glucosyltransferase domain-containing protein [Treponema sp.]|nr:glucosyltransferase domain-containing protein [Treponema sp.]